MATIGIIGAGTGGLCAARHALANNLKPTIFEQTAEIGGTWVYTDDVGTNEFGIEVHTSMYQGLRTNLPKEVMGFPDFPIQEPYESYIPSEEILRHLNKYADHFKLREHIKFLHYVVRVAPKKDKWEIIVKNLERGQFEQHRFDYVMICNGHYHTAQSPSIEGSSTFQGEIMHSHDYRKPSSFKGKTVLVIGAGPSGMDLCNEISKVAERVCLSHHMPDAPKTQFAANVCQKPDVRSLDAKGAHFTDGSYEEFTTVLYCTGYRYSFPFLSADCGIHVDENFVQPLYKHCVNIENPSMTLIGLPFYVCAALMMDLQVRFVMEYITRRKEWPTKEEMLEDTRREMEQRWQKGYKKRQAHMMGPDQERYYEDLARTAGVEGIPTVMSRLHNESSQAFLDDLLHFRDEVFRIIDNDTFAKINK